MCVCRYAHVLLLLLRLRQAACHPFLTLARSDTDNDLSKLLLKSGFGSGGGGAEGSGGEGGGGSGASEAYLKSVVEKLSQQGKAGGGGVEAECPLCLERAEDPVVTVCGGAPTKSLSLSVLSLHYFASSAQCI